MDIVFSCLFSFHSNKTTSETKTVVYSREEEKKKLIVLIWNVN